MMDMGKLKAIGIIVAVGILFFIAITVIPKLRGTTSVAQASMDTIDINRGSANAQEAPQAASPTSYDPGYYLSNQLPNGQYGYSCAVCQKNLDGQFYCDTKSMKWLYTHEKR